MPDIREFIDASVTYARREVQRLRAVVAALAVLLVGACVAAFFAFTGQVEAERQTRVAEDERKSATEKLAQAQIAESRVLAERAAALFKNLFVVIRRIFPGFSGAPRAWRGSR